jgi:hypothetical protein
MIAGFKSFTQELNDYERYTLLPVVADILRHSSKKQPVINRLAVKSLMQQGYVISDSRFRKVVAEIRLNAIVPNVIASSKGYYRSDDQGEVSAYIDGLYARANAIRSVAQALQRQGRQLENRLF